MNVPSLLARQLLSVSLLVIESLLCQLNCPNWQTLSAASIINIALRVLDIHELLYHCKVEILRDEEYIRFLVDTLLKLNVLPFHFCVDQ